MQDQTKSGSPRAIRPTDEEEAAIQRGIAADPDNPEWTDDQFRTARRARNQADESKQRVMRNTAEEEAAIQRGIAADPDNPEWTADDFRRARRFTDLHRQGSDSNESGSEAADTADATAYLLRSPANDAHLERSIAQLRRGETDEHSDTESRDDSGNPEPIDD